MLKAKRNEPWQGRPARLLVFDVPPAKKDKHVKRYESTLVVWMAPDGTPLASRARQRISAQSGSGMGHKGSSRSEYTLCALD